MTIAHEFKYHKAKNISDTTKLLSQYNGSAKILSGGTDIINLLREEQIEPEALIDIKDINELKKLEQKDNAIYFGALVTFNDLIESELIATHLPAFKNMAMHVASKGVRNRATVVGNICSAVPSCDSAPLLLVYEAEVLIVGSHGERTVTITDWFLGPKKTVLKPDEIVIALKVPLKDAKARYLKLGRYQGEDLAQANVAILALNDSVKISFGAVAATPIRAAKIEKLLAGKNLDDALIKEAVSLVAEEISPITDIRASKEYRLHMVEVMLKEGLEGVK